MASGYGYGGYPMPDDYSKHNGTYVTTTSAPGPYDTAYQPSGQYQPMGPALDPYQGMYAAPPPQHLQQSQQMYMDPPPPRPRSWKRRALFVLSVLVGLGWLGPIIYLLVVNIQGKIIGAAAWCENPEKCNIIGYTDPSGTSSAVRGGHLDEDNHNLLGALQFAAKALEVWFIYLATSLVWQFTVLLARRAHGLPISYILTHLEFGDLRVLLDPILYRAAGSNGRHTPGGSYARSMRLFIVVTVLMCLIANLMGPSVAVLIIPTLHWNNGTAVPTGQFHEVLSTKPPSGDNAISGCDAAALEGGNWNCAYDHYGMVLQGVAASFVNEIKQTNVLENIQKDPPIYVTQNTAVTMEGMVPFSFNTSRPQNTTDVSTALIFAPSRQTLRGLSDDLEDLFQVVTGQTKNETLLDQYEQYNSSAAIELARYGPIIGMGTFPGVGKLRWTTVADDKEIRCYENYLFQGKTKCMRTGTGWNASNEELGFTLDVNGTVGAPVTATVYWSDKATVLTNDNDPCFANGTIHSDANCDYDSIFAKPSEPATSNGDRLSDMLVAEWSFRDSDDNLGVLVLEMYPGLGFGTYTLDMTSIFPILKPMTMRDTPEQTSLTSIVLHPSWYLLAWNVANDQNVDPSSNQAAALMQNGLNRFAKVDDTFTDDQLLGYFQAMRIATYAGAHGASLVPYTTNPVPADTDDLPALQPLFFTNVHNQIWGWGIDSRTSKLGLAVCCLGVITVLVRTFLLFVTRATEDSALKLISSAMKHQHQGEFNSTRTELDSARVRYQLLEDEAEEEKVRFVHVP